jgi:hypothetical protein
VGLLISAQLLSWNADLFLLIINMEFFIDEEIKTVSGKEKDPTEIGTEFQKRSLHHDKDIFLSLRCSFGDLRGNAME